MNNITHQANLFHSLCEALRGQLVVIASHLRPDGDSIGSQIATCRILRQAYGVDAYIWNHDTISDTLRKFLDDTPVLSTHFHLNPATPMIAVDCTGLDRISPQPPSQNIIFNIDHHISNTHFAKNNIVIPQAPATAFILAEILFHLHLPIDPVTAQALYLGIVTDTNQFKHCEHNPAELFKLTAALIQKGANPQTAIEILYYSHPLRKFHLLSDFLATLKFECNNHVCIGYLTENMFTKNNAQPEDVEGFVDYTYAIDGVQIGALLEELSGKIKVSLRCKNSDLRMDRFASQFGGGGHSCAAGFRVNSTLEAFYPILVEKLKAHLA